jgi:hypothetical protein
VHVDRAEHVFLRDSALPRLFFPRRRDLVLSMIQRIAFVLGTQNERNLSELVRTQGILTLWDESGRFRHVRVVSRREDFTFESPLNFEVVRYAEFELVEVVSKGDA